MKVLTQDKINKLNEEVKSEILKSIGEALVNGYCESGNFGFTTESLSETRLYKRIAGTELLIEFNFSVDNYPAFNAGVLEASDEEFKQYIRSDLEGWVVKKCQFEDIKIGSDNCVASIEGYKIENNFSENFKQNSNELIHSFAEAEALLKIASQKKPESDWRITAIYEEDTE